MGVVFAGDVIGKEGSLTSSDNVSAANLVGKSPFINPAPTHTYGLKIDRSINTNRVNNTSPFLIYASLTTNSSMPPVTNAWVMGSAIYVTNNFKFDNYPYAYPNTYGNYLSMTVSGAHNTSSLIEQNYGYYSTLYRTGTLGPLTSGNIYNYGIYNGVADSQKSLNDAYYKITYGIYNSINCNNNGTSTCFAYYGTESGSADTNWGFVWDSSTGNNFLGKDNVKTYFGGTLTTPKSYITHDGTNMIFYTNLTTQSNQTHGLAWFSGNISAQGYITRTSVYNKEDGTALDKIKDANTYLDVDGAIDHKQFYGYTTYEVTDYSRPEITNVEKTRNVNGTKETYTEEEITYPYTKTEEGVDLGKEIDVLRQAMFELKQQNDLLKTELCTKDKTYTFCAG